MSAASTAIAIIGAAIEAARAGVEVYRAVRGGDEVKIVRAPQNIKQAAHAEAERRRKAEKR